MLNVQAMVHSKQALDWVIVLEIRDNNNVIAEYNGKRYTAIYNVFNGYYYVDDLYGEIK